MTEYDNYYIQEILNYRKPVRKFCPKTDILNIRASVRKKFIDYYMQENLQQLMRQQAEEKKYLDDIDKFATICEPLFHRKKYEYFTQMNKQIAALAPNVELTLVMIYYIRKILIGIGNITMSFRNWNEIRKQFWQNLKLSTIS